MKKLFATLIIVTAATAFVQAQYCDGTVPNYTVNLSGDAQGIWISPPVARTGSCCSSNPLVKCIQFTVTLDQKANGLILTAESGPMASDVMYYVDCNADSAYLGDPVCINDGLTHTITVCAPWISTAEDINTYKIRSLHRPEYTGTFLVLSGCNGLVNLLGLDSTGVTWNSNYPGPMGTYNSQLSCGTTCNPLVYTPMPSGPSDISYTIYGNDLAGCPGADSISVKFSVVTLGLYLPQTALCGNDIMPLSGGYPIGGTYSGPGISIYNPNYFDAVLAGFGNHIITYSYTDTLSGCSQQVQQTVQVSSCLSGMEEETELSLELYPNPTADRIFIRSAHELNNATLQLLGMNGQVVDQQNISIGAGASYSLDMTGLAKGIYIVRVNEMNYRIILQ